MIEWLTISKCNKRQLPKLVCLAFVTQACKRITLSGIETHKWSSLFLFLAKKWTIFSKLHNLHRWWWELCLFSCFNDDQLPAPEVSLSKFLRVLMVAPESHALKTTWKCFDRNDQDIPIKITELKPKHFTNVCYTAKIGLQGLLDIRETHNLEPDERPILHQDINGYPYCKWPVCLKIFLQLIGLAFQSWQETSHYFGCDTNKSLP